MKSSVAEMRDFSNKTIYKQKSAYQYSQQQCNNLIDSSSQNRNQNKYIDTQTNRAIKSRVINKIDVQESLMYKNMKLTTMIESISSFTTCLHDTKWIFNESYKIIKQFLIETSQYFEDKTIKRIKLDNISKEYLNLKKRFDQIDLKQIGEIVSKFLGQKQTQPKNHITSHHKNKNSAIDQNHNMNKTTNSHINKSITNPTNNNHPNSSNINRIAIKQTANLSNNTNCMTVMRQRKNSKANILVTVNQNQELLKLKIRKLQKQQQQKYNENIILAEKYNKQKGENQILRNIVIGKKQNELRLIEKIKMTLKTLKELERIQPEDVNLKIAHIEGIIMNFSNFQERIRDQLLMHNSSDQNLEQKMYQKQQLTMQINTMLLQLDHMKIQQQTVKKYMQRYAEQFAQKKKLESQLKIASIDNFYQNDSENLILLWMQANTIQNILANNQ